jgi:hypothetical protein
MTRVSLRSIVTAVVVAAAALFILREVHPSLILSSSTPAGGDMGAHVWGPAYLRDHLLHHGRLYGWAPDWYAGFPYLTFYFPLPALLIVALNAVLPYTVAFKIVTILGVCLLPVAAWAFGKLADLEYPTPALLAAATLPFVFDRFHTIYGGNLPATLAGEFSFSLSLVFALLFLGVFARGMRTGRGRALAAVLLACTGLSHLLPTVFALVAAGAIFLFHADRHRLRYALTTLPVGGLLAAFWLLPFQQRLAYTNDMGWERKTTYAKNLFPFLSACRPDGQGGCNADTFPHVQTWHLAIVFALAAVAIGVALSRRDRIGRALSLTAVAMGAIFVFMPAGRLWNARFLPFWFLCAYLLAALAVGEIARWLAARWAERRPWTEYASPLVVGALVLVFVALPVGALPSWFPITTTDHSFVPDWVKWNYTGYEGKAAYPEYKSVVSMMGAVGRDYGCGRAHWEYESDQNRFGTPMALMLLPYWTKGCIGSMEGLYFESSATTPYHFLTAAEASAKPSNPQRDLPYPSPSPDVDAAVRHFQMLGVRYYLAFSDAAKAQAASNADLTLLATTVGGKWAVYRVADSSLVEPLTSPPAVVRGISHAAKDWLEVSAPWFEDPSRWSVPLASSGPSSWPRVSATLPKGDVRSIGTGVKVSSPPRSSPLPSVQVSNIRTSDDRISFDVSRVGVPVLVKTSYFPNWNASGASGPWRVTPNFMVVVPTSRHVSLHYGWTPVEGLGWLATLAGVVCVGLLWRRGGVDYPPPPPEPEADDELLPPEDDLEPGEPDEAAGDALPDRAPTRAALLDDDPDLVHTESGALGAEDELGVEQVGAEPAFVDDRHEG